MPNTSHCPQWAGIIAVTKVVFIYIQNSGNFNPLDDRHEMPAQRRTITKSMRKVPRPPCGQRKIYDLMFKYHRDFTERNQSGLGTCSSSSFVSAFPAVRSCTHSPNKHWMRLLHREPSTLGIVSVNSQVTCLLHWLTHEFQGSRNCFLSSTVSQMPRTRLRERSANVLRPCKPTPLACACKHSFTGMEPRFLSGSATIAALNDCRRLWPTKHKALLSALQNKLASPQVRTHQIPLTPNNSQ